MSATRREREPRRIRPGDLAALARAHLERYVASTGRLRAVLERRVRRATAHHGDDPAPLLAEIDGVIAGLDGTGLLDDVALAGGLAGSLRRRGDARPVARQKMLARGLPPALVDAALAGADAAVDADGQRGDADLAAAAAYARRRHLGPFRAAGRAERRDRDLAAMARAGHRFDVARRVIDCDDPEALRPA